MWGGAWFSERKIGRNDVKILGQGSDCEFYHTPLYNRQDKAWWNDYLFYKGIKTDI